ncbi:MAG: ABC transporter permease [Kibdelosporangium sp.]
MTAAITSLRWTLADSWTITRRTLIHWVREPAPVVFGLGFSILIALMFAFLFGGAMAVPGGGDYKEFLMPGMFGMNMLFGISATMTAVSADATRGVTDRLRSMPMSPAAVLLGRGIADMFDSMVVLVGLVLVGLAIGWQPHGSAGDTALAFVLLLLLRFAFIWLGVYLGLVAKSPEMVGSMQVLEFPLGFLSSAFVAPATMPGWLGTIAECNPLSATVGAIRELFGNPGMSNPELGNPELGGGSWIAQHAVPMAFAWPLVLIAIFAPLAVRRYRRLSR